MQNRNRLAVGVALASALCVTKSASAASQDPATEDFERRCAQPGVVRCIGFDRPETIKGREGNPTGITKGASEPVLDSAIKASGASSLKFTIPSNSAADTSGSFFG